MLDKLQELKNRQKEWRDISVGQLSNTNNVLLTFASGLFVFCIDKGKMNKFHIDLSQDVDIQVATYWISILLLGLSIVYGIGVLLSRLYDFRITRHIALTRQRYYKKYEKELSYNDLIDPDWIDRVCAMGQIVFRNSYFITSNEIEVLSKEVFENKFSNLRKLSAILGTASWRWTKIQIGLFLLSGLIYFVHIVIANFS